MNGRPIQQDVPRCHICHEPIGAFSYDIWALGTTYDEGQPNEPIKTGLEVSNELDSTDYIQVGPCCLAKLQMEWSSFLQRLEDWEGFK